MSNYYYFGSEEEYEYALKHGWIKNAANKSIKVLRTTANKIKLNYKKKQIAKTPVKSGANVSEINSEKSRARTMAKNDRKTASDMKNRAELVELKKSWNRYETSYNGKGADAGEANSDKVKNNRKNLLERGVYDKTALDPEKFSQGAMDYIAKYRRTHPGTQLSNDDILRNSRYRSNYTYRRD